VIGYVASAIENTRHNESINWLSHIDALRERIQTVAVSDFGGTFCVGIQG
jgi:hypothetical protein